MCAIAALASCSQNDDVAVPTDSAPPAKVTIRFAGSEGMTRAIGSDDAVVNNLTAFSLTRQVHLSRPRCLWLGTT